MHKIGLAIFFTISSTAAQITPAATLNAGYEQAPPDIFVNQRTNTLSGPAREIIEEAVGKLGYQLRWSDEENISLDLVAKLNKKNLNTGEFLPPMLYGFEDNTVYFLVKKGHSTRITDYKDLKKFTILVKTNEHYFEEFDGDKSINKITFNDEESIIEKFINNDNYIMATKDLPTANLYFKKRQFTNWEFSDYFFPQITEQYYSIPKKSAHVNLHAKINCSLYEMRRNGRVSDLYSTYKLEPPIQLFEHRTSIAQQEMCEANEYKRAAQR